MTYSGREGLPMRHICDTTYYKLVFNVVFGFRVGFISLIGYFSARTEPSGWTNREYEDTILHAPEYNYKPLLQSQRYPRLGILRSRNDCLGETDF